MINPLSMANGAQGFLSGILGGSDRPYKEGMKELERFGHKGEMALNPFVKFGEMGMPNFMSWLNNMRNPSQFINNLMGGYNESPFAKFQQEQAMREAQNLGSASGLTGSTPLMQFAQQNARDISSQDMNQWLQNVLGINNLYGQGINQQIGYGSHAADSLSNMYSDLGKNMASGAYGAETGRLRDRNNLIGGLFQMGKGYFGL